MPPFCFHITEWYNNVVDLSNLSGGWRLSTAGRRGRCPPTTLSEMNATILNAPNYEEIQNDAPKSIDEATWAKSSNF